MNTKEKISHEQGATVRRIGLYVSNWWRWVRAGVVYMMLLKIIVQKMFFAV
tara:strand:- start:1410 stop:1562 length:153 start_codon:yes stop_codon:yes gene_type:complete